MARVDDFGIKPQTSKTRTTAKRSAAEKPPRSRKAAKPATSAKPARGKKAAEAGSKPLTEIKTVTVMIGGTTYCGWYWADETRVYVTYHEQVKDPEVGCQCCAAMRPAS